MFDFHEKRRVRNVLYSKPLLILLGLVVIGMTYSVYGALEKERETRVTKEKRAEVLDELHVRESALQEEIDRLDTEKGIEAEIRSKFEVAKDGEEVIVIVEAPEADATSTALPREKSLWERLFGG